MGARILKNQEFHAHSEINWTEVRSQNAEGSQPAIQDLTFCLEDMIHFPVDILLILAVTEFISGNVANVFIVLVNCTALIRRQQISPVDGILTALAFSRIGLLWVIFKHLYDVLFTSATCDLKAYTFVDITWILCNHFSTWLSTSLGIFYLLKIANFSNFAFLYLKRRVKAVIVIILLGSLSLLVTHLSRVSLLDNVSMNGQERNLTCKNVLQNQRNLLSMAISTIENLIPFTVSLMCFVLLIFSLGKHLQKMQLSGKGVRDPSTQVHIRALQTVISFLLLFACYFLGLIISTWDSTWEQNRSVFLLCQSLFNLYPSVHSFILAWGNKRLKEAFLWFLWQLKCWLTVRE